MRAYKRMGTLGGTVRVEHIPEQAGKVIAAAAFTALSNCLGSGT
jgi:hypothetical protein